MIPFGAWGPDQYDLNSDLAGEAKGVLPGARSYGPWPGLAAIGVALGAACRGAFAARTTDGSLVIFAGTDDGLYKWASTSAWTDVSGASYALPADEFWSFAQFNDQLVACNGADNPQVIDVDAADSVNFADLGGAPPQARYCQVVGDVLLLMDLASAQGAVAASGRIQAINSGFRDITHWTVGKKSCDFHTFWAGGFVQGATSLLAGLLFQQRSIQRMVQTRSARLLAFAPVQEGQGTDSPYSIVTDEATTYFSGTDGFAAISAAGVQPIGNEWVNNWFLENCNQARLNTVVGALDPVMKRVFWLFPGPSNDTTTLEQIICYDIVLKRWTHADLDATYLFGAASPGQTLSDIAAAYPELDDVPYPFGSRVWQGGAPGLAAFGADQKLAFFAGNTLEATVQTALFQPIKGRRGYVNGFHPMTDAENATARIGGTERPQGAVSWSTYGAINVAGRVTRTASWRTMRVEVTIPAGEDWSHLQGIDFQADDLQEDGED